ncbi:hypothetical protein RRG08_016540, partial [Elysia crispata]
VWSEAVAFSVALTKHLTLANDQIAKYNKVLVNEGGGYSETDGVFSCPRQVIKKVNEAHALSQKGKLAWLELYHGKEYIESIWAFTENACASASNSAVLYLQKGAQVYIQSAADVYLFGPTSEIYTTFSGHLIAS